MGFGVVDIISEFSKLGSSGNSFNSFWGLIFWSKVPINENVWVPVFAGNGSNSIKLTTGINDLDLYNLIWFLAITSTKYVPSSKPGIVVPCAE